MFSQMHVHTRKAKKERESFDKLLSTQSVLCNYIFKHLQNTNKNVLTANKAPRFNFTGECFNKIKRYAKIMREIVYIVGAEKFVIMMNFLLNNFYMEISSL